MYTDTSPAYLKHYGNTMKIISPFKDYYDYVAHLYGVDDTIVYVRKEFGESVIVDTYKEFNKCGIFNTFYYGYGSAYAERAYWSFQWIVVCGRRWLAMSRGNVYRLLTIEDYRKFGVTIPTWIRKRDNPLAILYPPIEDSLVNWSIKLNAPVFGVECNALSPVDEWHGSIELSKAIPRLDSLGFSRMLHPNEMYMNIYNFISNVLRESPDKRPPVEVDNRTRITAHGFDLKESFRHRNKN